MRLLDHTQRHTTVGRIPLDEWSARRGDLYLTTHNTHNRQTSMPTGGIRSHDLSRRAAVDLRLRPAGHWDRWAINDRVVGKPLTETTSECSYVCLADSLLMLAPPIETSWGLITVRRLWPAFSRSRCVYSGYKHGAVSDKQNQRHPYTSIISLTSTQGWPTYGPTRRLFFTTPSTSPPPSPLHQQAV